MIEPEVTSTDPVYGWPAYVPPGIVKAWGSEPRTAVCPKEDNLYYLVPSGVYQHRGLPYPNGQYRRHVTAAGPEDYSDPRFFRPAWYERKTLFSALEPTINEYKKKTGEDPGELEWWRLGYEAAHGQLQRQFEAWIHCNRHRSHWHRNHEGAPDVLFKLDRWYGLIEHWRYAPNSPVRSHFVLCDVFADDVKCRVVYPNGMIMQNPTFQACRNCIYSNIRCYGHKENINEGLACTPCIQTGRRGSCDKRVF